MDNSDNTPGVSLILPVFTGKKIDFTPWLNTVRERCIAFEEVPGILSQWLFTAAEWQYQPHAGFTPAVNQGDPPTLAQPFVEFQAPNGNVVPNNLNALNYRQMLSKRAIFRTSVAMCLPQEVKHTICPNGEAIYSLPPQVLFQRLRDHYERLDAEDLSKLRQSLITPYNQDDEIQTLLSKHLDIHYTLATAGYPLDESDKIERLETALKPCGLYDLAIRMFHTQHPRVDHNTFTLFYQHIKVYKIEKTTASSIGYASLASEPTYEQLKELVKQLQASSKIQAKPQAKPQAKKSSYCWTHGACTHNGYDCRYPLPGHIADANFQQRKGGSNRGCSKMNN